VSAEDRLREALHEYAAPIEPAPGSWARIEAGLDERSRRRARPRAPRALALAAAALAVVLIVGTVVVVRATGDDSGHRVAAGGGLPAAPMPDYAVAVTDAHDLVVMDARTGEVVRTLASDVRVTTGTPALEPSPDGESVYFTSQVVDGPTGCGSEDVVLAVPVTGGDPKPRGTGDDVALSPDGTRIATAPLDADRGCAAHESVVEIRPVESGGSAQTVPVPSGTADLSLWGSSLAYTVPVGGLPRETWVTDLDDGTTMHLRDWSDAQGPYTFRAGTGELVGAHGDRITAADPTRRRFLADVTRSPVPVAGAVRSDPSGAHLLWTGTDGGLYHWSASDGVVRRTAGGVVAAAWLPATAGLVPPRVAPDAPVIVALRDGRLDLLDARGEDAATYGSFGGSGSVAAMPDGEDLLVSYTADDGGCAGSGGSAQPEIDRIDRATRERTRVVGGARAPVVTPNGMYVAYGMECDGVALGVTNLLTGENYRTDFLPATMGNADVTRVEVLGASPNSRRLVYRVTYAGTPAPRYYASCLWPLVEHKDHSLVELPYGPAITASAFAGDDDVALAETGNGSSEIRGWSLRQDGGAKVPSPVLFSVPDRVTSLVADASGSSFLALTEAGVLYRWHAGDAGPTQVADGVTAAAWLG
jgi:hypothetical protein